MAPFEELQELWQAQPEQSIPALDIRGLTEELRRFGRHQTWINLAKAALLIFAFTRILTRAHGSPLVICGVLLLCAGLVTYLVLDWRNQIGISRLDFSAPSVAFVHQAHARLRDQLNPMRRVFWLMVVTIGGGFNLILLARDGAPLSQRIVDHLGATALPFAAYVFGARVREFRFKRECGAVLEKLETLLHALGEHSL